MEQWFKLSLWSFTFSNTSCFCRTEIESLTESLCSTIKVTYYKHRKMRKTTGLFYLTPILSHWGLAAWIGGWGGGYISLNESTILNYHRSTVAGFKLIVEHIRDYCGWETTLIIATELLIFRANDDWSKPESRHKQTFGPTRWVRASRSLISPGNVWNGTADGRGSAG